MISKVGAVIMLYTDLYVFPGLDREPRSRRQDFPFVFSFTIDLSIVCSQGKLVRPKVAHLFVLLIIPNIYLVLTIRQVLN